MLERREFLVGCAAALITVGTGPCGRPSPGGAGSDGPLDLSKAGFSQLTNESFRIFDGSERVVYANLVTVGDGPTVPGLDQFSLEFEGDFADWLEPGLYELYHTRMGSFQAFLDSRAEAGGPVYESFFNKFTDGVPTP